MAIIVQKYGGSSVADASKIREVARRVVAAKERGDGVVVVVSAMGKTTDELLRLARSVVRPAADVEHTGEPGEPVAKGKAPPRRELDMLVSTGERVSMALLAIAIADLGHDAISFTGSQSGILTNDRHFDARIIEVRPHRIEDELARGKIVIVAGYQGMSYKREITTLGRGGSDTTAVALAAALGADRCEIYSDVDGVYSADPRVVPDAVHLPELDLAMLQEMAEAGAKVLNAQAVEWARRAKIAIVARKTTDGREGQFARETVARESSPALALGPPVRGIVGLDRVVAVTSADPIALFVALAEADLPILEASASRDGARAWIPLWSVPDWRDKAALLAAAGLLPGDEMALVSVVGAELTAAASIARFVKAVGARSSDIAIHPLRLGAIVPRDDLEDVQRRLHGAFVAAPRRM